MTYLKYYICGIVSRFCPCFDKEASEIVDLQQIHIEELEQEITSLKEELNAIRRSYS
jgi:hypothetical protein